MKKIISLFLCVVIFSVANITATADENIITGNLNDTVTYEMDLTKKTITFSGNGAIKIENYSRYGDPFLGGVDKENFEVIILETGINEIYTEGILDSYYFTSLKKMYIYNDNLKLSSNNTLPIENATIYANKNSTAYEYVKKYGGKFYAIDENKEYKLINNNKKLIDMLPKDIGVYEPVFATSWSEDIETGKRTGYSARVYHEPNTNRKEYQEILKATQDVIKNCKTDLEKAKAIYNYVVYKKYEGKMNFTGDQIESVYSSFKYAWGCMPMTLLTQYMLYLANIPSVQAISDYHTWCLALIDNKWVTVDTAMHYFGEEYTNIIPTESHHITEICFNHKNMIFAVDNLVKGIALIGLGCYYSIDEKGYSSADNKTLIDKRKNITLPKWATEDDYIIGAAHFAGYKGKITMPNGKVVDCKDVLSIDEEFHTYGNVNGYKKCKYYDNGKITKKPTCSSEGVKTYTCVCGKTKKVKIKKLAHQPTNKRVSAKATYFNNGYKNAIVCKKCKEVIKGKTIKKLKLKTPKLTVKAEKKKITVKYAKVKDSSGFELKYTIGKKTCTKTFKTKKSAIKTIKGLKKGSYKVRIRAFVKQGSKTAYSNWSKTKTVKVK